MRMRYEIAGTVDFPFPEFEELADDTLGEDYYEELAYDDYTDARDQAAWNAVSKDQDILYDATYYSMERV